MIRSIWPVVALTVACCPLHADHQPPIDPILPGTDHSHEDHTSHDHSLEDLSGVDFSFAYLVGTSFQGADLNNANFTNANLFGATLLNADVSNAIFTGSILGAADLRNTNPSQAITDTQLRSAASLVPDIILSGNDLTGFDLSALDLSYAKLDNTNLSNANLAGAIFSNATLHGANLQGAILAGADLSGAYLPAQMPELPVIAGATVNAGTLTVQSDITVESGGRLLVIWPGLLAPTLTVEGSITIQAGGVLDPQGPRISISATSLDNSFGGTFDADGITDISGDYTQETGVPGLVSTLRINVGSYQVPSHEFTDFEHGQLLIAGDAILGGTLEIEVINSGDHNLSYVPALGDTFQIISAANRIGQFDNIVSQDLGNGLRFDAVYGSDHVLITVVPEPGSVAILGIAFVSVCGVVRKRTAA